MVEEKNLTNLTADCFLAFKTLQHLKEIFQEAFLKLLACYAMRSLVDVGAFKGEEGMYPPQCQEAELPQYHGP